MIAGVVVHWNPAVYYPSNGAEQPCAAFWNRVLVFVPKVKGVSHEVDFSGRSFICVVITSRGIFEPTNKVQFAPAAEDCIRCTEVQVRGEVNAVQRCGLAKQFVQLSHQRRATEVGSSNGTVLVH